MFQRNIVRRDGIDGIGLAWHETKTKLNETNSTFYDDDDDDYCNK